MTKRSDDRDMLTPAPTGDMPATGLFANTPASKPRRAATRSPDPAPSELFAEDRTPAKRTTAPRSRPPRWRDEDMPVRPGDVLALGLTHRRAVIGQVTAVNDHCIRLNSYTPRLDRFTAGTVMVGWQQIDEYGPVARKRGDLSLVMEPLLTWAESWQTR
ncbi:hypothetical protein [Micromonospora carbonacea]|uniref:Uncharacterized protein n=1 Tax=Micromonospora carbonacea TaxID=47853 RepID=A0A1C5AA33_9ACTN|nr:hypothetical protein [Micromonospora carbonacea]SCF42087.1 hypothetical protein GA0070563_11236 [Micromonospora carbonacea]